MRVERGGESFDVVDDPHTRSWRFWEDHFAAGAWEPATLASFDEFLTPETTLVDVGSWVGPTVLWGSRRAGWVVAVEPDPVAVRVLRGNVAANCSNVSVVEAAVSADPGTVDLFPGSVPGVPAEFGNSMSTLRGHGAGVAVEAVTFAELLGDAQSVGLVKIDIEGGEADVFPANTDLLRSLDCPIILALHLDWIDDPGPLLAAVDTFEATTLDDHPTFPTLLLR